MDNPGNTEREILRDEYVRFMEEFMNESDRACIVLASAEIESRLEWILSRFLTPSPTTDDKIFSVNGPLSSLSNRIEMAFRLGLIDERFYRTLHKIRNIRNEVVHNGMNAALTEGSVLDKVKDLVAPFLESKKFRSWIWKVDESIDETSLHFRWVVSFVIVMLDHLYHFTKPIKQQPHSVDPEEWILDQKEIV